LSGRLVLNLSPSRRLAAALAGAHAAAAACVWSVLPEVGGALLAVALLALGLAAAWARGLLAARDSVRVLEIEGPALTLGLASGARFPVELAGRRFVTAFMVALPLRRPVRRTLLVTGDMLGKGDFRRLRLWALWGRLPAVAAPQLPA